MKKFLLVSLALTSVLFLGCKTGGDDACGILADLRLERMGLDKGDVATNGDVVGNSRGAFERGLAVISGDYDLLSVVNTAISNNLTLKTQFLKREEAKGGITQAYAAAFPKLSLGGSATGDLVERGDNPDTYGFDLSLSQPLWRSGAVSAGVRYADLYSESTDESIRQSMQLVVANVVKDYLGILLSQQMVDVYGESVNVAERMLDTAKKRRSAGTASDYEVLRAEVEVASSKAAFIKEVNSLRTRGITLLQDMGVDQRSRIAIVGSLQYKPETNDVRSVILTAMANRPDLLIAEANIAMAKENVKIVQSEYGPSMDLVASGKYQNPNPNDHTADEWATDASAGVRLSWKLFDGNERRGKMVIAKSRLAQAEAALREAEERAGVEVAQALLDLRNADELFVSQSKNIDLSKEALRMLENGFKVGKNTQIEVLDARSALTEAMGQYYNAIYSHSVARINVRLASGTIVAPAVSRVVDGETVLSKLPL